MPAEAGIETRELKMAEEFEQPETVETEAVTEVESETAEIEAVVASEKILEPAAAAAPEVQAAPAVEAVPAAEKPAIDAPAAEPVKNENFRWYILHAYSGFERKVKESIMSRVQAFGLESKIGDVVIPTEKVTEIYNGKKRTVERVFIPGYVLILMELDNHLWHVLKETPKVTGFLGTGDKPVALTEDEIRSLLNRSESTKDKPRQKIKFEKNEQVRINDGPFANFNGVVDEVNEDRETLKVMVTIFGRSTPVELEFAKVEKIE